MTASAFAVLDNKDVAIRALGGVVTIRYSSGGYKLFKKVRTKNGDV